MVASRQVKFVFTLRKVPTVFGTTLPKRPMIIRPERKQLTIYDTS